MKMTATTQLRNVFFHVIHYGMEVVFFKKDVGQANAAFFLQARSGGLSGRQLNAHFFMEKGDQLIRFNAGDKRSTGILLKHDLVGCGLAINLHQVKRAIGHTEFLHWVERVQPSTELPLHEFNARVTAM
jgi:hypothetical protein